MSSYGDPGRYWRTFDPAVMAIEDSSTGKEYGIHSFGPVELAREGMLVYCETNEYARLLPYEHQAGKALVLCPQNERIISTITDRGHVAISFASPAPGAKFWEMHSLAYSLVGGGKIVNHSSGPGVHIGRAFKTYGAELVESLGGLTIGAGSTFGLFAVADVGFYGENTEIGENVQVDNHVHIGHSATLRDRCTITAGCIIGGWAEVGEDTFVGIGSVIRDRVKVGPRCFIGMGSIVTKSVPADTIVAGNPARSTFRER